MTDPRHIPVTVTLTAMEWDALIGGRHAYYARNGREAARRTVEIAVEDAAGPAAFRRELAKLEVEATLPQLDGPTKRRLAREVRRLLDLHANGRLNVDHLGIGEDSSDPINGFAVVLIPHTVGGAPALHFCRRPGVWFERREYPLTPEGRAWFIKLVKRYRKVQSAWNPDSPWVTVSFQ